MISLHPFVVNTLPREAEAALGGRASGQTFEVDLPGLEPGADLRAGAAHATESQSGLEA